MHRKLLIGIAAITALCISLVSNNASARGGFHGGGFHGGGFHGGFFHHDGFFRHRGFFFINGAYYYGYPYEYGYYGDYSPACFQVRRIHTPVGWRLREVWVCG